MTAEVTIECFVMNDGLITNPLQRRLELDMDSFRNSGLLSRRRDKNGHIPSMGVNETQLKS